MRTLALPITIIAVFCALFTSTSSADTLIYNNATLEGFFVPGMNYEIYDYGTSSGGLISKLIFGYRSTSVTSTVWVRFYRSISTVYYDTGILVKQVAISNLPSSGGSTRYFEYVLPEADRFTLPAGTFGYSITCSSSTMQLALASGGAGNDDEMWEYDYDWLYGWGWYPFWFGGYPWAGLYMKIYSGPPIEEVTCDIAGYTFHDLNANGIWDAGEPDLSDWEIYVDTNNNNQYDAGTDPNAVTDPNGMYFFENLPSPATYTIREVLPNGWTQTLPGSASGYEYIIATEPNNLYSGYNFGNMMGQVKYGGGIGTQQNPYQIWTASQMNEIGTSPGDWDKSFILMDDLDMGDITGTQYHIIGSDTNHFTGSFNGNYHVIRNFNYTTANAKYYVGVFGYTSNAQIFNLGLVNVNVFSAGRHIGGLVGYQINGTANNCYVTDGQVSGSSNSQYVGGLAGFFNGTTVSNCRSNVSVNSGTNSFYVGGFAGRSGNLTNCYSAGAITSGSGSSAVGGLVGSGGTMTSCYWDMETSGFTTGFGSPKTTEQMQTQATFTGWNFTDIWRICDGTNYPRLQWEPLPAGDFVCPEGVELADLMVLCDEWLMEAVALSADIAPPGAPDGKVNLRDFALFAENWLVGTDQ